MDVHDETDAARVQSSDQPERTRDCGPALTCERLGEARGSTCPARSLRRSDCS